MLITPPVPQINVDLSGSGDFWVRMFLSTQALLVATSPTLIWGVRGGGMLRRRAASAPLAAPSPCDINLEARAGEPWAPKGFEPSRLRERVGSKRRGQPLQGPVELAAVAARRAQGLGFDSSRQFTHSSRPVHASVHATVHACKK